MSILRKKDFDSVKESVASSGLRKTLTAFDLIMIGLGGIIGTGIFVLTGTIAAQHSGPAIMVSYALAGVTCIFVALAYAELSTMLPTSGTIYTYSYVALGEMMAWMAGSVIILELTVSTAVVASAWSGYIQQILKAGGIELPRLYTSIPADGGIINLPATLIICFVTFILYLGTKDSKRLNTILVFIKLAAIAIFVFVAIPHFDIKHWDNFMPYGFDDVLVGASVLFFAFTGFGSVATAAEECKDPKRDLTIGVIGSLTLATFVYILVGGILTGIVNYSELNNAQPLAYALMANGSNIGSVIVATGAVCGMTTVMMMNLYGQSRIAYAMARDGLYPEILSKIHPKYDSPYMSIIFFATIAGFLASFGSLDVLSKVASCGALLDYVIISLVVIIFRFKYQDKPRPFKCPILLLPISLFACLYLLYAQLFYKGAMSFTGKVLISWFALSGIIYFLRYMFINKKSS